MPESKKKLLIIDSNSVIHRAYHALPPLTTKNGELTNAIYGFLLVFLKAIKEFKPEFIAATFDLQAPTFRHKKFKAYKAKRPTAPEELYSQIPKIKDLLRQFNVPIFEKEGFEADDIIGTIAKLAPRKQVFPKIETIILSGDLDVLQLVDKQTKVYTLRKGVKDTVLYNENLVKEKYQGLKPRQLIDLKALRGDPSDNIPGVTGIGEKIATELILKFHKLDELYEKIEKKHDVNKEIKSGIKELLIKYKDQAFISRELVKIDTNVPIDFNLKDCRWRNYNKENVKELLEKLEFNSLIPRLPSIETKEENIPKNLFNF